MKKPLLFTFLALAVFQFPAKTCGQFTDPRNYDNTPINVNQIELGYAFVRANASVDTSLIVTGARLDLNQGTMGYTRYFGLLHRLTWVEASIPVASLGGSVSGTNIQGSTTGGGDSSYQIAVLLKGGPALTAAEFEGYKPSTNLGLSLTMTAPTGLYHSDKILNLGSDRWSFKPEFALTQPLGAQQKWEFNAYANVAFFTDNTTYRGREVLRQEPLLGLEGHISYSFKDSLWASLDTRYSFRGTTFVDDVDQNNAQRNFLLGTEVNLSLNSRNSLVFEFGRALVHQNGPVFTGFSVRYDHIWGKGLLVARSIRP